jgi:hypothetical protein
MIRRDGMRGWLKMDNISYKEDTVNCHNKQWKWKYDVYTTGKLAKKDGHAVFRLSPDRSQLNPPELVCEVPMVNRRQK